MNEIIDLIVSNGLAVGIIIYFLYKDYKFNDQIINVISELKDTVGEVKEVLGTIRTMLLFKGDSDNGNT